MQITCRVVDDRTVVLEGSSEALEFLGKLLLAQAVFKMDCGFQIEPNGPGRVFSSPESSHGIYIHCKPCSHGASDA